MFLQVLGKILSVAVKYNFHMPPYFTLLLRSLASFEGQLFFWFIWILATALTCTSGIHSDVIPFFSFSRSSILFPIAGLAVAADPNFKTFQAAYHFVSTRLLYDNSAATRKILHSVCHFTRSILFCAF